MKNLYISALLLVMAVCCRAQTMEFGQLTITPYIAEESGFDAEASRLLQNKLAHAVALANASGGFDKRFVITPKVDVSSVSTTATIPQKVSLRASFTFFVGDGVEGTLFSSCNKELTGVGDTQRQAILSAIRKINAADKELQHMIEEGRNRIEKYYKAMAPKIIAEANSLMSSGKYDEATACLAVIPRSCGDYQKAQDLIAKCVNDKNETENNELLIKARAEWSANPTQEGAAEATFYLNNILNPSAKITAGVNKLTNEMRSRLSEVENKKLQLKQQRIASEEAVAKERIKAAARVAEKMADAFTPRYNIIRWF